MSSQENPHVELFRQEATELLADVQECLLLIESDPRNKDAINRLFRAMHSIKGSGGMFGYDRITDFTHHVETTLVLVRDGGLEIDRRLIDLILASHDCIMEMLQDENGMEETRLQEIIAGLHALIGIEPLPVNQRNESIPVNNLVSKKIYRIRFKPDRYIFHSGTDPLRLVEELDALGICKVIGNYSEMPSFPEMDPELCYLFWDIILTSSCTINEIEDIFIFVRAESVLEISIIDDEREDALDYKKLGEILIEKGDIEKEHLNAVLQDRDPIGKRLVDNNLIDRQRIDAALLEQESVKASRQSRNQETAVSTIRVNAEKLDRLVDLVGELVTAQARISRIASLVGASPDLADVAEELESLTSCLRDETMSIRMVPIGSILGSFRRLVRDLGRELGKDIDFICHGEETEMDKVMVERLKDPLTHILRNSIDHGIEQQDVRTANGKPYAGTIKLEAMYVGAHVAIRVSDDGKGLDIDAIRLKAIEKGLIDINDKLENEDIYQLIFKPGFSTSKVVTEVSGRGVGMDVVRQNIEALRGSVGIHSEKGIGTTITLKMPLTLAIIDGLMVNLDNDSFIMPLAIVEECVDLDHAETERIKGRNILNLRGVAVPFVRLRERLKRQSEAPLREQVVITNVEGKRMGIVVDSVVGSHQTVLKNLGPLMRKTKDVSGATILGDGSVALILDLQDIQ